MQKKLDFVPWVGHVIQVIFIRPPGRYGPHEEYSAVTSIRKAWKRLMLIVLMPDSVMGRSQQGIDTEAAMLGTPEVRSERVQ